MRCRDVERLIIGTSKPEPGAEDRLAVEDHVKQCSKCADLLCDWQDLQGNLKSTTGPHVSAELDERVRALCHAELDSLPVRHIGSGFRITPKIPWFVYAALAVLAFLTVVVLAPGAEALFRTYKITSETTLAFVLILQNVLMLFFAPIVLGRLNGHRIGRTSS